MYFIKTPTLLKSLFPQQVWNIPVDEKSAFLTFDDGPTPGVTEWVLDTLKKFEAKATFFLVGKNAVNHPEIVERILAEGHSIGNHTFTHLNGWRTTLPSYTKSALKCGETVPSNLFRPPYGRITRAQARRLGNRFRIIMWDVLSGDFDTELPKEKVVKNVLNNTEPGSIIVFHDSVKAEPRLKYALPRVLNFLKDEGYNFNSIEMK